MGKRKEESTSKPRYHKRQRQEYTDEHSDESNEEESSQSSTDSNFSLLSAAGEVGIIESIQLKNFMCHSMLGPFQFGSNLNFVVGNNGTTATNRGSSLKMFVRDGETSADISITLRNQGRDAFKPEVYGGSIIVNQHINLDGNRNYKLKSKSGTLISSKKEELIGILDHFNIQVDNPVSILTQEMSKHFLQSKNEGDKYKFFMKATQLEQMKEDYSSIMKTKENTCIQIEQGVERLQELKQLYCEKKERYKSIRFVNDMRNHLEDLKHKMAWAVVGEMEKEIQPIKEGIRAEEGNTEKFVQKLEECQVKVNEAEEKYKVIQDKLTTISEEAQALHPQCISLKADVQARRKAVNEAEVLYNRSKTELKRLGKDDEQLRKRIEELKSSANRVSEPEKLERQRKIAHLRERLKAFHDEEILIGQQVDQFQQAIYKCKEDHARLRREDCDAKQALDAKQKQLRELFFFFLFFFLRFGSHIPAFFFFFVFFFREGRFRHKPVGPLGAFIHPKDAELTLAVESCLKSLVQFFFFFFFFFERTLQLLMLFFFFLFFFPQIIVNKFHFFFFYFFFCSRIFFFFIFFFRPPKNCREAFFFFCFFFFERRYYSSDFFFFLFFFLDVEAEIRLASCDKEIENKKAELTASQQRVYSIENEIRQNEDHLRGHRQHQKELQVKIVLHVILYPDSDNEIKILYSNLQMYEDEAEENKGKMESVKRDMQQQSGKVEELKNILQVAEKKFEEMKEKIHQVEEIAGPIKDELNQADSEVENSKRRLQHYEDKQKEHLAGIKRHKELLAAKEKELEEKIAQARQIYPERIEVSRTVKSLDAEMNRLRERINSENDRHGNREEIVQQFHDAKERYEDANSKVKNLKKFIRLLEEIMTQRFKIYQQFLRLLSLRCKLYFDHLLRTRACSGKILFDHKNETLSITVQPREEDKAALNDVRSLSGGERSFSTVCFILSLWSITESPFRCLDEFDVYMDMVNRRIAMDMILKVADSQHHRQFILLTPQSMSSLPTSSRIRILRMQDPERGQRTLNFQNRNDKEEDQ
ncbi:SMC6 protein, partial [Oceanites oceanicus]|nr:SMC6 protein [Oceanites oceanicus]